MMRKVDVSEAIDLAKAGHSLDGIAINDLQDVRVGVKDVLLLSEFGIVIPEQNILYSDDEVAYDPEFDDMEWKRLPSGISLEAQAEMVAARKDLGTDEDSSLHIELDIKDKDVSEWATDNYDKIRHLLTKFVRDLYQVRTIIEK